MKNNKPALIDRLLVESFGTFLLIAIFMAAGTYISLLGQGGLVSIALSAFLAIVVVYPIGAKVSGGHFNPAISLMEAIRKQITFVEALLYILVQLIGGVIGAGIIRLLLPSNESFPLTQWFGGISNGYGDNSPSATTLSQIELSFSTPGSIAILAIASIIVAVTYINAQNTECKGTFAGSLMIGAGYAIATFLTAGIVGAGFNPVEATAVNIFATDFTAEAVEGVDNLALIKGLWLFWLVPVASAALVAIFSSAFSNTAATAPIVIEDAYADEDDDDDEEDEAPVKKAPAKKATTSTAKKAPAKKATTSTAKKAPAKKATLSK
ncbi:MAG: aquaporin [Bifidobacteriaceae bacterium]|jgi:aquaporin Z|nr:aquaporin [Bifidobacteriaceae bacterium]